LFAGKFAYLSYSPDSKAKKTPFGLRQTKGGASKVNTLASRIIVVNSQNGGHPSERNFGYITRFNGKIQHIRNHVQQPTDSIRSSGLIFVFILARKYGNNVIYAFFLPAAL
jgi:hypothetical protein